jgi:hypothetical protein
MIALADTPAPTLSPTPLTVANAGADPLPVASVVITHSPPSPWLTVALLVQVGVLLAAGVEFVRRSRRR